MGGSITVCVMLAASLRRLKSNLHMFSSRPSWHPSTLTVQTLYHPTDDNDLMKHRLSMLFLGGPAVHFRQK
jgi:hypothetical protein